MITPRIVFAEFQTHYRSAKSLTHIVVSGIIAFYGASFAWETFPPRNFGGGLVIGAGLVVAICGICVAAASLWTFLFSPVQTLRVTDVGVEVNEVLFAWEMIKQLDFTRGATGQQSTVVVSIQRPAPRSPYSVVFSAPADEMEKLRSNLTRFLPANAFATRICVSRRSHAATAE